MHSHYDSRRQCRVATIYPGEFYSSNEDLVIATVLGTCVAVALYDDQHGLGGLNHFMLAKTPQYKRAESEDFFTGHESGRYGINSMELLINDLLKKGACKRNFTAKVFGGSAVLAKDGVSKIAEDNIEFAFDFLRLEDIPVIASDVGGVLPRKILFYPATGKAYVKKIVRPDREIITKITEEYYRKIKLEENRWGKTVLFDDTKEEGEGDRGSS